MLISKSRVLSTPTGRDVYVSSHLKTPFPGYALPAPPLSGSPSSLGYDLYIIRRSVVTFEVSSFKFSQAQPRTPLGEPTALPDPLASWMGLAAPSRLAAPPQKSYISACVDKTLP